MIGLDSDYFQHYCCQDYLHLYLAQFSTCKTGKNQFLGQIIVYAVM